MRVNCAPWCTCNAGLWCTTQVNVSQGSSVRHTTVEEVYKACATNAYPMISSFSQSEATIRMRCDPIYLLHGI